ncbi:hypothetical protein PGTUg99_032151 [Puccinia graminis f. sp. tritici]|uniref:Secreted protein n=1 Tax=Puccinia graminis f. sp. tritici TaxID=56615 RepID=A0A5B0Q9R4_PUCGR|nr:hypothetical protein PGTUg99_032151 [Puccinia graminis f. sp. tritici]
MQLSNLFPALMVILIHGQAYVQCFKCTDADFPKAACGQFLMGDKTQANDPDQDKSGITFRRAHPTDEKPTRDNLADENYTCNYSKSQRKIQACCHHKVPLDGKRLGLGSLESICRRNYQP